jgi:RNA polymerase sigma-70 factor (ECF subfamily)
MHQRESEDLLIQRAVKRDRAAFAALYDNCIDQVYRHVYYRVSNQGDAEDITQEAFIKAWKAINKYRKTGAPFAAWLIAIARNLIADHYKARKKLVSLDEAEVISNSAETSPEAITETSLNRRYARDAILKLKGEKQKVILMRFIDGFSYEEIAEILNKSEGAVRVIQYRALNDLRRMLMRSE